MADLPQPVPVPLLVDTVSDAFGALASVAVAYFAFRGYRLTGEATLFHLHASFALIGAGLLVHAAAKIHMLALGASRPGPPPGVLRFELLGYAYAVSFLAEAAAYLILVYEYLRRTEAAAPSRAAALPPPLPPLLSFPSSGALRAGQPLPPLVEHHPAAELLLTFLLVLITYFAASNYSATRDRGAALVTLGFASLAASHLLYSMGAVSVGFVTAAGPVRVLGFSAFLGVLAGLGGEGG